MTSAPHTLEGVSGSFETLPDLSLARGTLDRAGLRRRDPDLVAVLLKDPLTKVLELAQGRAQVMDSDRGCLLVLRPPAEQDVSRLALFLGQDGHGTAYLGVLCSRIGMPGFSPRRRGWPTGTALIPTARCVVR
jgi:NAD+ diphosphatase